MTFFFFNKTNETCVFLIHRKKKASRVSDFHPISLVTSLYKIIPEVPAERLKKAMAITISNCHADFVDVVTDFGCYLSCIGDLGREALFLS